MGKARIVILAFAVLATVLTATACSGSSEPQDLEFDLVIRERKINLDPAVISVKQGDSVTLRIETDEGGEFHLHGYDLIQDLEAGTQSVMTFTASATGRFEITLHPVGKEGEHEEDEEHEQDEEFLLLAVEVLPR